jgi:small GTP-binding protein
MKIDIYKIILIGDSSVGKTSLVHQFIYNKMPDEDCTIGGSFFRKDFSTEDRNIKFEIWDTAGQERFKSLAKAYYRGTNGCICVFDITNRTSFLNLNFWLDDYTTNNANINKKVLIVANKCDAELKKWQVDKDEIKTICDKFNCPHIFVSCVKKQNVNEVFLTLVELMSEIDPIEQFQIETSNKINIRPKINPIEEPVLCSC